MFKSDNQKEYFNKILSTCFLENDIIQQSSCFDTLQQNEVAKRKNKHLLEVVRSLMFITKIHKYLFRKAILIAIYLINRIPSRNLNFETPMEMFEKCFPMSRLIFDLPLKILGFFLFIFYFLYMCIIIIKVS